MNTLHAGIPSMPKIAIELSKLGSSYRFFDWPQFMELGPGALEPMRKALLDACRSDPPEFVFLHIQRPGVIDEDLLKTIKTLYNPYIINFTYDVARPMPPWFFEIGEYVDLTLVSSEDDVDILSSNGITAGFISPGYDDEIFTPIGEKLFNGDIVFMGNNYHEEQGFPLTKYRSDMVDFLKEIYQDRFKVYGNQWKYNDGNFMYKEFDEAAVYRGCKMAINISHFELEQYSSDRIFRIMGTGAFCLSKWYPGIEKDFSNGIHLRVWKNFEELRSLIDHYTIHEDERNRIAKAGQEYIQQTSTWKHRMNSIYDMATGRIGKEYKSRVVTVAQQFHVKPVVPVEKMPVKDQIEEEKKIEEVKSQILPEPIVKKTRGETKGPITLNDYFDNIYCINLDRRPDRWEECKTEFEKNNLKVQRFTAIDGKLLPEDPRRKLLPGEIGCLKSHIAVLNDIVAKGYRRALVLEDDVQFIDDVQGFFSRTIDSIPPEWCMLYFGGSHLSNPIRINNVISRMQRTYTTTAYGIVQNTAKAALNKLNQMNNQVDVEYSKFHKGGLCFTYVPSIAWQRPGKSDIQNDDRDYTSFTK